MEQNFLYSSDSGAEGSLMFSRVSIISAFVNERQRQAQLQLESAQRSFDTSAQMDGKMASRYDTQKEEHAADGNLKLTSANRSFELLKEFNDQQEQFLNMQVDPENSVIEDGFIINLNDENYGESSWFFLSKIGGGMRVQIENTEVVGLNPDTKLGESLIGKKKGNRVRYEVDGEIQTFKILEIM